MPLYPEKLLIELENTRQEGPFKPQRLPDDVSKNIFLMWQDLQEHHLRDLGRTKSMHDKRQYLFKCLMLDQRYPARDTPDGEKHAQVRRDAMLDLVVQQLTFCKQSKFSPVKTSTLISIVLALHLAACEIEGPPMPLNTAYNLLESLLLRHAVERPFWSTAVFTHTDIAIIAEHLLTTYLRHIKLYQYVFGSFMQLELKPVSTTAHAVRPGEFKLLNDATSVTPMSETTEASEQNEQEGEKTEAVEPQAPGEKKKVLFLRPSGDAEKGAGSETAGEGASEVPQEADLETYLKTEEDRALFEKALGKELERLQEEMIQKMAQQQAAFTKRLEELEG